MTLASLGFGIVALAIYVLALLTSSSDSAFAQKGPMPKSALDKLAWRERSPIDRRQHTPVGFPLIINGVLIERDRRSQGDRRMVHG